MQDLADVGMISAINQSGDLIRCLLWLLTINYDNCLWLLTRISD